MADFSGRNSTSDNGEMQISPDGRYLIVTNRQNVQAYGGQPDTHLRLYRIVGATGGLELVSTFTAPNATISSLDFSPQNGYLYYIATTGNSAETPNTIQHRLRRLRLPSLTNPQNVLNGATEVRRTVQGHLLVTRGQEVRTLSAPNAPTVPAVLASMATNYTWSGGPSNPLQTNVALQPIIAHAEQGVVYRTLGHKHYELTDHLGNVRVVVSDVKLSTLDGNNEPYAFVADVVSRTDFYAHGSAMPGRHYPGSGYRYGFNGKELDETGHYDFDARNFDARIGRFTSIDRMAMLMVSRSPFAFAANNPILFIDKDGNLPILPLVFKGLVGAGIDAMMQFTINMVIYDFNPQVAFENIDLSQVALSGVQGMIPWNPPGGKWGQMAFDVVTDMTANFVEGNYNGLTEEALYQQLFLDVLEGAAVSLGTGVLAKKLEPHLSKIAVWMRDRGLSRPVIRRLTGIDIEVDVLPADLDGVVYLRTDKTGGLDPYSGQAEDMRRYKVRKKEHMRAHPNADFEFKVIYRGNAKGKHPSNLTQKEQWLVDALGGPKNKANPYGRSSNKKNPIKLPQLRRKMPRRVTRMKF